VNKDLYKKVFNFWDRNCVHPRPQRISWLRLCMTQSVRPAHVVRMLGKSTQPPTGDLDQNVQFPHL